MNVENSPDHLIPTPAIVDMIYGHSDSDLEMFLSEGAQAYADHFMAQSANYWPQLSKENFAGK